MEKVKRNNKSLEIRNKKGLNLNWSSKLNKNKLFPLLSVLKIK